METTVWIIIAASSAIIGYVVASLLSLKRAASRANVIIAEAGKDAELLKEKKLVEAKEESLRIVNDAERVAQQKLQKVQSGEARVKQREL